MKTSPCRLKAGKNALGTLLTLLMLWPGPALAAPAAAPACSKLSVLHSDVQALGSRSVAFFAQDLGTGACYQLNPLGVDQRHAPWSSFKIPNLIIAMETGVAPSLGFKIAWDPKRRPRQTYWPADWAQDQTLETAFRRSAAWYYQELALRIGGPRYRQWLSRFAYGNALVADGDDAFWLGGSLRISPREQARFLARLLTGELGVSARSRAALEVVSLIDSRPGADLFGKTGSGPLLAGKFEGPFEGWLVGYLRRQGRQPIVYALGPDYASIKQFRQQISEALLQEMGVWPGGR